MTEPAASDLTNEMFVRVCEEAALWELPGESFDLLPDGPVRHGPWTASECAVIILEWFDAGWIELYLPNLPATAAAWDLAPAAWQSRLIERDGFSILTTADARDLLLHTDRWTIDTYDGHASVSMTDRGQLVDRTRW